MVDRGCELAIPNQRRTEVRADLGGVRMVLEKFALEPDSRGYVARLIRYRRIAQDVPGLGIETVRRERRSQQTPEDCRRPDHGFYSSSTSGRGMSTGDSGNTRCLSATAVLWDLVHNSLSNVSGSMIQT